MKTFKLQLGRWTQGLIRGSVLGSAVAVKAWAGTAVIGAAGWPELAISIKQGCAVFVAGLVWHGVTYVAEHPLPLIGDEETSQSRLPSAATRHTDLEMSQSRLPSAATLHTDLEMSQSRLPSAATEKE